MAKYGISEAQFREFLEERLRKAIKGEVTLAYLEREIMAQALRQPDCRKEVFLVHEDHERLSATPWHYPQFDYKGMYRDWLNQQLWECLQDDVMPVCARLLADAGGLMPEDDPF